MARVRVAGNRGSKQSALGSSISVLHSSGLAIIYLLALHIAFFWRAMLGLGFLAHSDILYFFEPAKSLMHEALRAGRLPLWSPYIFCGYPIAAEGQIAAFYPLGLLISWLLPSPVAINWLIISHLMLASIGMYLLSRDIGLMSFGAFLSAVIFSFSGYLLAHSHHVSLICAASWLPWVLLFVDRAWRGPLLSNVACAALAWGASALCGHPQTLFHISLLVVFWVIWRAVAADQPVITHKRAGRYTRAIGILVLVFALGCGLASVQLLMTSDLSKLAQHGDRGTLDYVTSFSLLPHHLIGLVAPNWQGTPADNSYRGERYYWEYVLYIGLVPLILALIGATRRRAWIWGGVAAASLVLALAQGNPLYHLLRLIPGFADFRVPARYVFLFTLAASILAGYGWESLASLRLLAQPRRAIIAGGVVAVLTVADLFAFDKALAPLAGPEVFKATPQIIEVLRQDKTWGRSFITPPIPIYADWSPPGGWAGNPDGWLKARASLPADVPQSFDLPIVGGYVGFVDQRQGRFFDEAMRRASQRADYSLYSLVGTHHFIMPPSLPWPGLPAADVPPFRIYLNKQAFPRAFAVSEVIGAGSDVVAATATLADSGRLSRAAIVSGNLPSHSNLMTEDRTRARQPDIIAIEELRPEHIIIRARSNTDALVVLNERWDPGWRARVDGMPVLLYETDAVLMGAPISTGEHTVEFQYQPRGLMIGRTLSTICLALCLLAFVLPLTRRHQHSRAVLAGSSR